MEDRVGNRLGVYIGVLFNCSTLKAEFSLGGDISRALPGSVQGQVKSSECHCACSEHLCSYSVSAAIQWDLAGQVFEGGWF